jgi:hypothetical protein
MMIAQVPIRLVCPPMAALEEALVAFAEEYSS